MLEQLKMKSKNWFDNSLYQWKTISNLLGDFEYFGTFHFADNVNPSFEDAQKSISHFKSVLRKKLFGRQDFDMDFLSVIETKKYDKDKHQYEDVKTHFHFLISEPPDYARVQKYFPELLIDCWCSLKEVDSREEQQVILIYTSPNKPSAEEYICKLRHSAHRFLDEVNSVKNQSTIYSSSNSHQLCSSN